MVTQSSEYQSVDIVGQDDATILFATALRDRHDGRYQDAVNKFERIIEVCELRTNLITCSLFMNIA